VASWLDIDPHGRVIPGSDEARLTLADRAGRFTLLPAAPDLLLARRSAAAGGASPRPHVTLCGDLAGFPLVDFIAFIHQSRLSGVLTVASRGAERSISFKDGEVRSAQSTAPGERVGEVAVKLGFVSAEAVRQASRAGRPIGKALVEQGAISANDLWKCFHEQVTAVFHSILLTPEGIFWLLDEPVTDRPGTPLAVSTQTLLMDGIRRIDELSLFKARIPGPEAFLRRREPMRPVPLKPVEQQLLDLVDGRRSVAQIATAAHVSDFDATKIFFHLAEAGYVEATAEPAGAPAADLEGRLAAVAAGYLDMLRLVAAALPDGTKPGFLEAVRTHLGDEGAPFAPLLRRLAPHADGGLDQAQLLANLAALRGASLPDGEVARLLADALREVLFFYLFLAGERIPSEADEALGAEVRRRLDRLGWLGGA